MLDGLLRPLVDPFAMRLARLCVRGGVSADAVTVGAFVLGLAAAAAIALGAPLAGLALFIISRVGDALDGAIARLTGKTDFGGFLDIVLDFGVYGAIPFAFALADPAANAVAAGVLLLSFYFNGASFLAYAVVAERRGMTTSARGDKSIFFTTGLAEASETLIFVALCCLVPGWFAVLAWTFAALCFYTAISRIVLARRTWMAEP